MAAAKRAIAFCVAMMPATVMAQTLAERLDQLGAVPCTDSALTCVTLPMPRDHDDPSAGTIDITFGVRLAGGESQAVMFFSTGGPGTAGLALADGYLDPVAPEMLEAVDFVFFDQRGTGPVHGIACPETESAYAFSDPSIARPDEAIAIARGFAESCVAEVADPTILPYLGTDQAIRDLEAFRQAIGGPRVWIYGESYGTQFAQTYATAYPDIIDGVILDGIVDLSLTSEQFYAAYTTASENILDRVLASCDADPACAAEMGAPARDVYARVQARLEGGAVAIDFPLGSGEIVQRIVTASQLAGNAFSALYGNEGRADFLRVLAAAGQGNLMPMARLGYYNLGIDSETDQAWYDPSWFGSAYYAINCLDYEAEGATPEAASASIVAQSAEHLSASPRLALSYMTERLVCAWWPHHGPDTRPAQFAGGDFPTIILNGDADPITPVSMAYDVFDHAQNSFLVVMQGGPHVIWGRNLACPDQTVTDMVVRGIKPGSRLQLCTQDLTSGYQPLAIPDPTDALSVARAVEGEIDLYPEVYGWYGDAPLDLGCDHGGTVAITPDDTGWNYDFTGCALWAGIVLDGVGRWEDAGGIRDGFMLNASASGNVAGNLLFRRDAWSGTEWVSGNWNGAPITMPRPMP